MTIYDFVYSRVVGVYVEDKSGTRGEEVFKSRHAEASTLINPFAAASATISKLLLICFSRCSCSLRLVMSFSTIEPHDWLPY
jgi:hypothetical protein